MHEPAADEPYGATGANGDSGDTGEVYFKGGWLACALLGHRWQRDDNWEARHVEYVLRVSWRPGVKTGGQEDKPAAWLVARRFREFRALHTSLSSGAARTATRLPHFPTRHRIASLLRHNRRELFIARREQALAQYMRDLLAPGDSALQHTPEVDGLLELSARTGGSVTSLLDADARDDARDDADLLNAEWLDYQLKLLLMDDDQLGGRVVARLVETMALLKPQLVATAARVPHLVARSTLVLKKFADTLVLYDKQRETSGVAQ